MISVISKVVLFLVDVPISPGNSTDLASFFWAVLKSDMILRLSAALAKPKSVSISGGSRANTYILSWGFKPLTNKGNISFLDLLNLVARSIKPE